ncbi:hypothetical protein [Phormidium tenue]|uniref:Uncharacterized protein n=1 Tax=Phormidium tenue NIES-30 TaxID=549789 RepID=A0A1U7J7T0_9CYAN|nr:hypothetical protein [Phormidium tenue]MBD2231456.1 hypothetical protein [Phormidium tenue FACHB-1052]OKH49153.1 hypothetical protein NIES30_08300 [Phormidium tenue NIES-30]
MSDKSPLFVSSMELIAHAVELYRANKPRKFKFVILHLANSVELILKDLLIDKGESIYKPKQPQTLGIWEVFDKLADHNVVVPERPIIELLIDDRNTIQHRFGFPDAESVFYYLECIISFFKRVLVAEYGVDLSDVLKSHLSQDELAFVGLAQQIEENEYALDPLFQISPESAVLQAYNLVEERLLRLTATTGDEIDRRNLMSLSRKIPHLIDNLAIKGYIPHETAHEFQFFRELRNRSAHAAHFRAGEQDADWARGLAIAKKLLDGLDRAIEDGFDPSSPLNSAS